MASCPECGARVYYTLSCRSHVSPGGNWVSHLTCDSAVDYACSAFLDDGDCEWRYTDGLNPENPGAQANAARRPVWLKGHDIYGKFGVTAVSGVPHLRDI